MAAAQRAAATNGPGPDLGPGPDPGSGSGPDPPPRDWDGGVFSANQKCERANNCVLAAHKQPTKPDGLEQEE